MAELNERSLRPTETPRPEPDTAGAVQTGRGAPGEGQSQTGDGGGALPSNPGAVQTEAKKEALKAV